MFFRRRWAAIGKDVVVLHVFPRGKLVPNMSNFGMKLETYLRMAQIPYEVQGANHLFSYYSSLTSFYSHGSFPCTFNLL